MPLGRHWQGRGWISWYGVGTFSPTFLQVIICVLLTLVSGMRALQPPSLIYHSLKTIRSARPQARLLGFRILSLR